MDINVILYPDFTALDVFGPVEVLGSLKECTINYYSQYGGIIENEQSIRIDTDKISDMHQGGVILIPGGPGYRQEVNNVALLSEIRNAAQMAQYVLCVCTGSAMLAKTGVLDGKRATSNKQDFDWVTGCGPNVEWIREARWVVDGKYYTSAGVSAGMDMALGFVSDIFDREKALWVCDWIEYHWNEDADHDTF